jgi:hypothetical protein
MLFRKFLSRDDSEPRLSEGRHLFDLAKTIVREMDRYNDESSPPLTDAEFSDFDALRDQLRSVYDQALAMGYSADTLIRTGLFEDL